jgi:hypothetical protein
LTNHERVAAIVAKGYTERQARFLVTVLLHSGVCMVRQYCEFTGIPRGQKTQDFFGEMVRKRHATPYTDAHSKTRIFHVQYRPLYEAIGEPDNRNRKPVPPGAAVERLMLLDSVLRTSDFDWLATERDKLAYFTRLLGTSLRRDELPHLTFGTPPRTTTRYFPDKLPIGVSHDGEVRVFTFLVRQDSPIDFRGFLHRHAELFRGLPSWRLRLLFPAHLASACRPYLAAFQQELLSPLRISAADELKWYFEAQGATAVHGKADPERFAAARQAFDTPRFRTLYQRWLSEGPRCLDDLSSPALQDALSRGIGEVETHVLPHPYRRLQHLVGTA